MNTIKMAILWYFGGLVPWSDFPSVHWCLPTSRESLFEATSRPIMRLRQFNLRLPSFYGMNRPKNFLICVTESCVYAASCMHAWQLPSSLVYGLVSAFVRHMALCPYGLVSVWPYGCMALWLYGIVSVLPYGCMALCLYGLVSVWPSGIWPYGIWPYGIWSCVCEPP